MNKANFTGYDSIFATRLRIIMNEQKRTQKEIADVLGISRQAISQYLDGFAQPNAEKLYKLAEYLKVSTDYLLGLSDIKSTETNIQAIGHYTGLNDMAIERLKHMQANDITFQMLFDENKNFGQIAALNHLMSIDEGLFDKLWQLISLYLFSDFTEKYVPLELGERLKNTFSDEIFFNACGIEILNILKEARLKTLDDIKENREN